MSQIKTIIKKVPEGLEDPDELAILLADPADRLKNGEVVAFPTETVYGLGGNALAPQAVAKIFSAKGRPMDNPLIVHIARTADLQDLISVKVEELPENVKILMEKFWPGPLTLLFPASDRVPKATTGGLDTVAVRFPEAALSRALIKAAGVPLAAPSANKSGRPSPTRAEHVSQDLSGVIPYIIDGGQCKFGVESTVVNALQDPPIILRPGGLTLEKLSEAIPSMALYKPGSRPGLEDAPPTPGLKYNHYAPAAPLTLVMDPSTTLTHLQELRKEHAEGQLGLILTHPSSEEWESSVGGPLEVRDLSEGGTENVAHHLFDTLIALGNSCKAILVQSVEEKGAGLAVMNRLRKAASKTV